MGRGDIEGGRENDGNGNVVDCPEESYYAFDHNHSHSKQNKQNNNYNNNNNNNNGNTDNQSNKSDLSSGYHNNSNGNPVNSSNVHGSSTKSAKSALLTKLKNKAARRNSFDSSEAEDDRPSVVPGTPHSYILCPHSNILQPHTYMPLSLSLSYPILSHPISLFSFTHSNISYIMSSYYTYLLLLLLLLLTITQHRTTPHLL